MPALRTLLDDRQTVGRTVGRQQSVAPQPQKGLNRAMRSERTNEMVSALLFALCLRLACAYANAAKRCVALRLACATWRNCRMSSARACPVPRQEQRPRGTCIVSLRTFDTICASVCVYSPDRTGGIVSRVLRRSGRLISPVAS